MPATSTHGLRSTVSRKVSMAGVAAAGAAALAFSIIPSPATAAEPATTETTTSVTSTAEADSFTLNTLSDAISGKRAPLQTQAAEADKQAEATYPDTLDGWIREALDIMKKHDIPGTYEGIHRNIMRESSGDPHAINTWDINAINGIPSKGLLQVIQPTFDTYHVDGTANDPYDPVANIVAACNYAADRYGSMDNVDSAY
ncbi:transglycosylase SLT domain-containing protein [Streptomyces sp. NBC_01803]|uniref:transglycosylase SLT domain-containing protein n=1 Tax=Streptomyces sp. NBC_01803 TaxID=2975946 RepID=UPI002DD9AB69|nr:transglycosylase SLT domain-containing protein [Streptomyces sp. NBC_01803]WSA43016.1 transglycosylase SLT domain-containing protein [Streptomyces sp. NBC_01803]